MASSEEPEGKVFDLDRAKADRFLADLAKNPFACVVVLGDGSLKLVAKGIPEEELDGIRTALENTLNEGDPHRG